MKTIRNLATATAIMLGTAGLASAQTLNFAYDADPVSLDPHEQLSGGTLQLSHMVFDPLVRWTQDLQFEPRLAESWEQIDGTTMRFKLRSGVTFHDGTPFDAEAVKANIERSKTLPESRRKSEVKSIESVEVSGPLQVKFNLTAPDATLLAQFADRSGMMMSPTAAAAAGADFGANLVCSGPFKFVEYERGQYVMAVKNDDYWREGYPYLDRIVWRFIIW